MNRWIITRCMAQNLKHRARKLGLDENAIRARLGLRSMGVVYQILAGQAKLTTKQRLRLEEAFQVHYPHLAMAPMDFALLAPDPGAPFFIHYHPTPKPISCRTRANRVTAAILKIRNLIF